jgi:hypothetical protein
MPQGGQFSDAVDTEITPNVTEVELIERRYRNYPAASAKTAAVAIAKCVGQ